MIEPSKISETARKREKENMQFRAFLKNSADCDKLDEQFSELHRELFAEYDCRQCNNCYRIYNIVLRENEIDAIAAFLGLSRQAFSEKYLILSADGCEFEAPCRFLKDNGECALQECKPAACREFPHTDKPGRLGNLLGVVAFAEVCPVVFEILERLKESYRFKAR